MPSPQLHHSAHHLRPQLRTSPQSISTLVVDLHWTHVGWCDHLDGCQQYDNAMQGQTHGQQTGLGTQNIYLLMQRGTALPRRGGRLGAWVTFSGRSVFHWKHGPWTRRSKFRTIIVVVSWREGVVVAWASLVAPNRCNDNLLEVDCHL